MQIKKILFFCLMFFTSLLLIFFSVLPHVIAPVAQKKIVEKVVSLSCLKEFYVDIETVSLLGIGLGNLTTGHSISVDSLFCSYSPLSLKDKRVDAVTVSGLRIQALLKNSKIIFRDFSQDPDGIDDKEGKEDAEAWFLDAADLKKISGIFPFLPRTMEIRHSVFYLKAPGELLVIPFNLSCRTRPENSGAMELDLTIFPFGQPIEIALKADLEGGIRSATLAAHNIDMGQFNGLISMVAPDVKLSGKSDITITMGSRDIGKKGRGMGKKGQGMGKKGAVLLKEKSVLGISTVKNMPDISKWRITLSHLNIDGAVQGEVSNAVCRIELTDPLFSKYDTLFSSPDKLALNSPSSSGTVANSSVAAQGELWLDTPMASPVEISYDLAADTGGKWKLTLKGQETVLNGFSLTEPLGWLKVDAPWFQMDLSGKSNIGRAALKLGMKNLNVNHDAAGVKAERLNAKAEGSFDFSEKGSGMAMGFTVDMEQVTARADQVLTTLPKIKMPGRFNLDPEFNPKVQLRASVAGAKVSSDAYGFQLRGMALDLPYYYAPAGGGKGRAPAGKKGRKGSLSIKEIRVKGIEANGAKAVHAGGTKNSSIRIKKKYHNIGNLHMGIRQLPSGGAQLNGEINLKVLPPSGRGVSGDIRGDSSGNLGFTSTIELLPEKGVGMDFAYRVAPVRITSGIFEQEVMAPYAAVMSGVDFAVTLASHGNIAFHNNKIRSTLHVDLSEGTLAMPEKNIRINGMGSSLSFKALPDVRSVPGQLISIDQIAFNDILISHLKVKYTLESIDSLLIENAGFHWCKGRVTTESMRISTKKDEYHLNLFCDRLSLSSILHQLGAFTAEGEGSLNGRIPISYVGGNISFNNGFLYSTPGEGGIIKISGTEILTAGIPMNTPQFAQIDLAREALKNYQYDWARLGFNTMGDELIVKMEFDGKPHDLLPFVYKKEVGSFVRVDASNPGSNFQGIGISVNLKLPFNKVLKFGNELNSLFK